MLIWIMKVTNMKIEKSIDGFNDSAKWNWGRGCKMIDCWSN